ncbi:MAG: riboflavin synthase [Parcubacteria group bacterium]|nr:riboflavin synthase [Parcubacteria group bacterium]
MFTGIIRHLGRIEWVSRAGDSLRLVVGGAGLFSHNQAGDSVAVNGVCLTVLKASSDQAEFELGPETMRRTTFGDAVAGQVVNLEWPMRLGETLDGHLVQGHVDGTAEVTGLRMAGVTTWLTLALPPELVSLTVLKGSIAVDGISLTVAEKRGDTISIMLLPYTVEHTNCSSLQAGHRVNIETDMLARHVAEMVKAFMTKAL